MWNDWELGKTFLLKNTDWWWVVPVEGYDTRGRQESGFGKIFSVSFEITENCQFRNFSLFLSKIMMHESPKQPKSQKKRRDKIPLTNSFFLLYFAPKYRLIVKFRMVWLHSRPFREVETNKVLIPVWDTKKGVITKLSKLTKIVKIVEIDEFHTFWLHSRPLSVWPMVLRLHLPHNL